MSYRTENYNDFVPLIMALPVGTYYAVVSSGSTLDIQASGDAVSVVRAAFPGQIWEKVPPRSALDWWEYTTTLPSGIKLHIYADYRGPLSCKKVEEKVTMLEKVTVPVTTRTETREVTRTMVRWVCPDV